MNLIGPLLVTNKINVFEKIEIGHPYPFVRWLWSVRIAVAPVFNRAICVQ